MSGAKLKVLVVDDEQAIRRFLRVTLEAQDYSVFEAANGRAPWLKLSLRSQM